MTLPRNHSRSEAVFCSLVSFSSQSHNSSVKSVFAMLATSHKEAFVQGIHQEIIQISCTQLGLYVLAAHFWKREKRFAYSAVQRLLKLVKKACCCRWASVRSTWNANDFLCVTRASCVSLSSARPLQKREPIPASALNIVTFKYSKAQIIKTLTICKNTKKKVPAKTSDLQEMD